MNEPDTDDVMRQTWCCLACSSWFRFGQLRLHDGGLHCTRCDALAIHPAEGQVEDLGEYRGDVGTIH